jgi:hypothetical protein
MPSVILTLTYPKGLKGKPIAITSNREILSHFKHVVLEEWRDRINGSDDEVEVALDRLEYERLEKVFSFLIPDEEG